MSKRDICNFVGTADLFDYSFQKFATAEPVLDITDSFSLETFFKDIAFFAMFLNKNTQLTNQVHI